MLTQYYNKSAAIHKAPTPPAVLLPRQTAAVLCPAVASPRSAQIASSPSQGLLRPTLYPPSHPLVSALSVPQSRPQLGRGSERRAQRRSRPDQQKALPPTAL